MILCMIPIFMGDDGGARGSTLNVSVSEVI